MTYPKDTQYRESIISEVGIHSDNRGFRMKDGWCFGVPKDSPITPQVGMKVRIYGTGIGGITRGLYLDGKQVYYRTVEEEAERHRKWCEEYDQEQRRKFESNKERLDAKYDALPEPFQLRIDGFRRNNPDFRWQYEGYEMAVCEAAVRIINGLKTEDEIVAWKDDLGDDSRVDLDDLGLSGNQFDCAVVLAKFHVTGRGEDIAEVWGADVSHKTIRRSNDFIRSRNTLPMSGR